MQMIPQPRRSPPYSRSRCARSIAIPRDTRWPYVQSWVLSVQREITKNTVLEIAYNGNHALRLPILADYNQAAPNAVTATCNPPAITTGCLSIQSRRPISPDSEERN